MERRINLDFPKVAAGRRIDLTVRVGNGGGSVIVKLGGLKLDSIEGDKGTRLIRAALALLDDSIEPMRPSADA